MLPWESLALQTTVVPLAEQPGWLERAWERVREEVGKGHQAYIVCPRIGGDGEDGGERLGVPGGGGEGPVLRHRPDEEGEGATCPGTIGGTSPAWLSMAAAASLV